jgi:hypothetical protein
VLTWLGVRSDAGAPSPIPAITRLPPATTITSCPVKPAEAPRSADQAVGDTVRFDGSVALLLNDRAHVDQSMLVKEAFVPNLVEDMVVATYSRHRTAAASWGYERWWAAAWESAN